MVPAPRVNTSSHDSCNKLSQAAGTIYHPEGETEGRESACPKAHSRHGGSDRSYQTSQSPAASLSAHLPCPIPPEAHPNPPSLGTATWGPGSLGSFHSSSSTRCPGQSPAVASFVPFGWEVPLENQVGGALGSPQTKVPRCEVTGHFPAVHPLPQLPIPIYPVFMPRSPRSWCGRPAGWGCPTAPGVPRSHCCPPAGGRDRANNGMGRAPLDEDTQAQNMK